jgi:hypothetical protein
VSGVGWAILGECCLFDYFFAGECGDRLAGGPGECVPGQWLPVLPQRDLLPGLQKPTLQAERSLPAILLDRLSNRPNKPSMHAFLMPARPLPRPALILLPALPTPLPGLPKPHPLPILPAQFLPGRQTMPLGLSAGEVPGF